MITKVYSDKNYMAINTDRLNSISVDYAIYPTTKFVRGVAVIFDISDSENSDAVFTIDIDAESYKIHKTDEIWYLKKYVITYITDCLYKNYTIISIDSAVLYALGQILTDRERD